MRTLFLVALVACGKPSETDERHDELPAVDVETTVPMSGGTVAVSPDGSLVAASDIAGDRVFLIDVASRVEVGRVELGTGDQPSRLIVDDAGIAVVSLRRGGAVVKLDLGTGDVLMRTPTCPSPRGLAEDGNTIWLACASGELVELDAATLAIRNSTMVEYDLRDVIVDGSNLLVSRFKSAELLTLSRTGQILDRRRGQVFDTTLTGTEGTLNYSPTAAWQTIPHPDGGVVMIHQRGSDDRIPQLPSNVYYGEDPVWPSNPRRECAGLVHSAMTRFGPAGEQPVTSAIVGSAFLPVAGAMTPSGDYAVVAGAANDEAFPRSPDYVVVGEVAFDPSVDSCAIEPGVHIADDSQLSAIAFTPDGTMAGVGRSPFRVYIGDREVALDLGEDPDPEKTALAEHGFDLFHQDAGVGMTCASCHLEGQEDGRTWIFPELGARRTQSMAGGLAATAPFHWGGEFANFNELMQEVMVNRMSHPSISAEDIQAIAWFMEGLEPTPVTPQGTQSQIDRGHELFNDIDVGCANCHSGELLTANVSADVGTGGKFQIPSLIGIGSRFPYMHNGCAPTLADRFGGCGGGDAHGQTSHLSAADVDALVVYLQSL